MQLRRTTPILTLAFLVIGASPITELGTNRYSFEISTESITDLTELGQGEMESTAYLLGELTVNVDEGTSAATVVLDTLSGTAQGQGQQITPALLAGVIGSSWSGTVDEKGRLFQMETESASPLANQLEGNLLRGLFPYIKPGVSEGDTWTDTLTFSQANEQGSQETTTILQYTAVGDSTYNGMKALFIASTFEATTTIFQEAQGGLDIEGTSSGTGSHFVGAGGRYIGGNRVANTELEVSGPAIPAIIPVIADTELTIALLP